MNWYWFFKGFTGFSLGSSFRWTSCARKPTDSCQCEQQTALLSTTHLSCGLHNERMYKS